jgi:hypothetical protein
MVAAWSHLGGRVSLAKELFCGLCGAKLRLLRPSVFRTAGVV